MLLTSGVMFRGSYAEAAKAIGPLSFGDIQTAATEAVKTMLLEGRHAISSADLRRHVRARRRDLAAAEVGKSGAPTRRRTHER